MLGIISETLATAEKVRLAFDGTSDRPSPDWIRGRCPQCGDDLVSNCYYVGGRGYLVCWECWSSINRHPTCGYRKVL